MICYTCLLFLFFIIQNKNKLGRQKLRWRYKGKEANNKTISQAKAAEAISYPKSATTEMNHHSAKRIEKSTVRCLTDPGKFKITLFLFSFYGFSSFFLIIY